MRAPHILLDAGIGCPVFGEREDQAQPARAGLRDHPVQRAKHALVPLAGRRLQRVPLGAVAERPRAQHAQPGRPRLVHYLQCGSVTFWRGSKKIAWVQHSCTAFHPALLQTGRITISPRPPPRVWEGPVRQNVEWREGIDSSDKAHQGKSLESTASSPKDIHKQSLQMFNLQHRSRLVPNTKTSKCCRTKALLPRAPHAAGPRLPPLSAQQYQYELSPYLPGSFTNQFKYSA